MATHPRVVFTSFPPPTKNNKIKRKDKENETTQNRPHGHRRSRMRVGFAGYGEVESVEGSYKLYTGVLISVQ